MQPVSSLPASISLFVLAGLCEIGGGYLVWLWLRDSRAALLGAAGAGLLVVYGVIPTLQPERFGRVYAVYGAVFIAMSMLWGWLFDHDVPDRWDWIGASMCIAGAAIMMYGPRTA
jgi:small multidrug resistance family-3 protein